MLTQRAFGAGRALLRNRGAQPSVLVTRSSRTVMEAANQEATVAGHPGPCRRARAVCGPHAKPRATAAVRHPGQQTPATECPASSASQPPPAAYAARHLSISNKLMTCTVLYGSQRCLVSRVHKSLHVLVDCCAQWNHPAARCYAPSGTCTGCLRWATARLQCAFTRTCCSWSRCGTRRWVRVGAGIGHKNGGRWG